MGLARLNLPSLVLYGGSIAAGRFQGSNSTLNAACTDCEVGKVTVANDTKHTPFSHAHEVLTFDETRDFAQRGRARVAPPQDHAQKKEGVRAVGRRSSVGNAFAIKNELAKAAEQERADLILLRKMSSVQQVVPQ